MNKSNGAEPLRTSFSSVTTWRECEQKYHYSYIDKLRPRVDRGPPTLGRMLHRYIEVFMSGAKKGASPKRARRFHVNAVDVVVSEYAEELQGMAWTAESMDADETAAELRRLMPTFKLLSVAYYRNRGKSDFATHKPLLIEEHVEMPVTDGIILPGVIDMVTEGEDGRIYLWEHKSTKNIPRAGRRFKDLQTLLYAVVLEEKYNLVPDEVIWNYIRTKEPIAPQILKDGTVTKRNDLDTLTELYLKSIADAGEDRADYADVLERIREQEQTRFFPRFQVPRIAVEDILLRDFARTAVDIKRARDNSEFIPVRNISPNCDWCDYAKLCEAAIIGGDDEDIKRRLFKLPKEEQHDDSDSAEEDELLESVLE